jgi:predicted ATPase
VLEQQFERLAPPDQALVEAANVAGEDFAAAAVAAAVGLPSDAIDARCAALARQGQFVHAQGAAAWPDGTVTGLYRFGHALYQDWIKAITAISQGQRIIYFQALRARNWTP